MGDNILVIKNGRKGSNSKGHVKFYRNNKLKNNQLKVKVRGKERGSDPDYQKVLNVKDSADLAQLFSDLDLLFNAPISKAFRKYKDERNIFF